MLVYTVIYKLHLGNKRKAMIKYFLLRKYLKEWGLLINGSTVSQKSPDWVLESLREFEDIGYNVCSYYSIHPKGEMNFTLFKTII